MLKNLFGNKSSEDRAVSKLRPVVAEINELEAEFEKMSADELRALTADFRSELKAELQDRRQLLAEARTEAQAEDDTDRRRQLDLRVKKLDDELFAAEDDLLTDFLPRAFAAVRESAKRNVGMRHFDVQLIG